MKTLRRLPWPWFVALCLLPFLFCSFFNFGFFASDEYWTGITRYIPAKMSSVGTLVGADDVKSPSQLLPFHGLAQAAEALGFDRPFDQYRFVVAAMGCFSTFILFLAFLNLPLSRDDRRLGLAILGFHFAAAIGFTRPMFEAAAAPFVALAAMAALRYERSDRFAWLAAGVAASTGAFLLRPQAGIVALVFLVLPLWKKSVRHFVGVIGLGVLAFAAAGALDWLLMGEFHGSLRRLITYNAEHGADYGAQPVFFFLPVLIVVTFGPWMVPSLLKERVLERWKRHRALILMLALFVLEHSVFPNKFERFLVPILPVVFILMIPLVRDLLEPATGTFRRAGALALNGALFVAAVGFEPQGPLLDLVRYANAHPEIRGFVNIERTLTWYPEVFQDRPVGLRPASRAEAREIRCDEIIVARQGDAEEILAADPGLERKGDVQPGPIDWLAFRLNPKHNARRAPLVLIGCGPSRGETAVRRAAAL